MKKEGLSANEQLVARLRNALEGEHEVELIETHISWVLLAEDRAWKIKKPVRFDFLDFSTLEKRHFFCEEELRLNRRFAPDLYEAVVPVTEGDAGPELGGDGPPIEFALQMKRFPQEVLLSAVAARGGLTARMVDAIAVAVARLHRDCPRAPEGGPHGRPEDISFWIMDNFAELRPRLTDAVRESALEEIETWSRREDNRLRALMAARQAGGCVRECHGDLHLRNMAWVDDGPLFFDCIEFNPALRWIDVMSEVAFVVMDLEDRGFREFSSLFLDRYLSETGDYAGLEVLRVYLVYRAMVRAKVAALRAGEGGLDADAEEALWVEYDEYIALARRFTVPSDPPAIVVLHGLAGAGKSTVARRLAGEMGAVRVCSDVERKRIFGLEPGERSGSELEAGIYSPAAGEVTYARIIDCAGAAARAGWTAVLDATFLQWADRERARELGEELGVPVVLVEVTAPVEVLEERVRRREEEGCDPSEAGTGVLRRQIETREELRGTEIETRLKVDSTRPFFPRPLAEAIRERCAG